MNTFKELHLSEPIQHALDELGYQNTTPIQDLAIPLLLKGTPVVAKAETGSGKTAAYAIPIIEHIDWLENKPQGLIISPNRELSIQIAEDITHMGRYKRIKALPIYGRASIKDQTLALKQKNHIISGTPGRLMDLIERNILSLDKLRYLVIDEADELLREEFLKQLEIVFKRLPVDCVISLFSATITEEVTKVTHFHETEFTFIDATKLGSLHIQEYNYRIRESQKLSALIQLLIHHKNQGGIIFTSTKDTAEKVCTRLKRADISAAYIHADLEQRYRIRNMNAFKTGAFHYLVATDLSARGIDVDGIDLVVNFDLPSTPANYTHRIGRIGRNGRSGIAINLISDEQMKYLHRIEGLVGKEFTLQELPNTASPSPFPAGSSIHREKKGAHVGNDITKLYINGGKRKKLRATDIVGAICSIEALTPDDIGIIEIKENETYVEILHNKSKIVLENLRERNIKGRKYKIHIAK